MWSPFGHLPPMSEAAFQRLREHVYTLAGVVLREELTPLLQRRLSPRLEALGLEDFDAYLPRLEQGPRVAEEQEVLLEAATTHETYFFREPHQLEAFSGEVLPLLERTKSEERRLRLWSAGCSSGEEAYTLAMLLEESGRFEGWDLAIYGSDLSRRMIDRARLGEYGPAGLRVTSARARERHFDPLAPGRWRVGAAIRERVSFAHLNLLDADGARQLPRMDAIFCRNVLIYMDRPARERVLAVLFERLHEGGLLMLGHAENLLSMRTRFEPLSLKGDLVYRRPAARAGGGS